MNEFQNYASNASNHTGLSNIICCSMTGFDLAGKAWDVRRGSLICFTFIFSPVMYRPLQLELKKLGTIDCCRSCGFWYRKVLCKYRVWAAPSYLGLYCLGALTVLFLLYGFMKPFLSSQNHRCTRESEMLPDASANLGSSTQSNDLFRKDSQFKYLDFSFGASRLLKGFLQLTIYLLPSCVKGW